MKFPVRIRLLQRHIRLSWKIIGLCAGVLLSLLLVMHAVYDVIAPFHPINPLVQEITIGERVIGEWKYAGLDDQGRIKFYNLYQTVVIPAKSTTFAADGDYVIVRDHTPTILTVEHRSQYASQLGLVLLLMLALALILFIFIRMRTSKKKGRRSSLERQIRLYLLQRRIRK